MPKNPKLLDALPSLADTVRSGGVLADKGRAKAFGQNFLLNPDILRSIVAAAGPLEGVTVLEIGPGPGGLTREIVRRGPRACVALEKDPGCCAMLQPLVVAAGGVLDVRQTDALAFFPIAKPYADTEVKVIANLPYNVATAIVIRLLADPAPISTMVLMFQKEVADRIIAPAGCAAYGRLSILAQYSARVEKVFTLSPGAFTPPPKVHSSVVRFVMDPARDFSLLPALEQVTRVLFQARRKMVRHTLRSIFPNLEYVLQTVGAAPEQRAEDLSVSQIVELAKLFRASSAGHFIE